MTMIGTVLPPTVGQLLQEEFLTPLEIDPATLARDLCVPTVQVSALLNGRTGCGASMALRLGIYFGNSPDWWMAAQASRELAEQRAQLEFSLKAIAPHHEAVAREAKKHAEESHCLRTGTGAS